MIKVIDNFNHHSLNKFRKEINIELLKINKKYNNDLSLLHNYISYKDINNIRLRLFRKINKLNWKKMLLELASKDIFNILGQDLLIQTKLNLSIQMPKDETSILPLHSDSWSADSPFQINLWIPLTDCFKTNSMFIKSKKESIKILKDIGANKNINLSKIRILEKDFINLKYGQFVIFNPVLLHGNIKNQTNKTRVSLNIRIKSIFSPEPSNRNSDRKYGAYYNLFNISENTKLAFDAINANFLE
tara:strand:+ start:940 stop:1674 length:735 start_codon:yes stop_codon:yes gene_type:complete